LQGAYALAVIWDQTPGALVVARKAAPLLIGFGEGEFLCASDTPALAGFTRTILPMEDGEVALLSPLGVELYDAQGQRQQRMPTLLTGTDHVADKREFRHFMLKEIHEQPETAELWVARHLPQGLTEQMPVALPFEPSFYEGIERIEIWPVAPVATPPWWAPTCWNSSPGCQPRCTTPVNFAIPRRP
jgi:glucosamine--fructose-6-phosphate aminotransferase (isomerizing)